MQWANDMRQIAARYDLNTIHLDGKLKDLGVITDQPQQEETNG